MGLGVRITFQVISIYDVAEIEDLTEALEQRGGEVNHIAYGLHELIVPNGLDWMPFLKTARDCLSVRNVQINSMPLDDEDDEEEDMIT